MTMRPRSLPMSNGAGRERSTTTPAPRAKSTNGRYSITRNSPTSKVDAWSKITAVSGNASSVKGLPTSLMVSASQKNLKLRFRNMPTFMVGTLHEIRKRLLSAKGCSTYLIINEPAMKVLVCVKQIPDPNAPGKLDPQTKRLVREGVDLVLDPGDEHGVEAGLPPVGKGCGGGAVISMGPPKAVDAIRRALAMGGHRGILVTDRALENSDAISTARAIAAAIKGESYDLIICGTESTDGSSGAVPAQLAELLGLPLLSFAKKLEVAEGKAVIDRQTDDGYDVVEAPLPAVVTVTGGINVARYPALRGIMQAKKQEVKQVGMSDMGQNGQAGKAALTQEVVDATPAEARKAGEIVEDKGDGAKRVADFLKELEVI